MDVGWIIVASVALIRHAESCQIFSVEVKAFTSLFKCRQYDTFFFWEQICAEWKTAFTSEPIVLSPTETENDLINTVFNKCQEDDMFRKNNWIQ